MSIFGKKDVNPIWMLSIVIYSVFTALLPITFYMMPVNKRSDMNVEFMIWWFVIMMLPWVIYSWYKLTKEVEKGQILTRNPETFEAPDVAEQERKETVKEMRNVIENYWYILQTRDCEMLEIEKKQHEDYIKKLGNKYGVY